MTVYLIDGRALVEQQEQWTADGRFIFLFPSCRASREISRSASLRLSCRLVEDCTGIAKVIGSNPFQA